MLELFHHGTSVCSQKVRLALSEKGLNWTGILLDLQRGDQLTPDYLKLNPKGVVPTLRHDGRIIRESTIIIEYIDDCFPERPLAPAAAIERAEMRLWMKRIDDDIHSACRALVYATTLRFNYLAMPREDLEKRTALILDSEWRTQFLEILESGIEAPSVRRAVKSHVSLLADMEGALTRNPWLSGDNFGLGDIACAPYVARLAMLGIEDLWKPSRPRITDWFDRIRARSSYEAAITAFASDEYRQRYAATGAAAWPKIKAIWHQNS